MNVFKRTKKKAWSTIGNYRCKSFVWHCITCETYKFKDTYGRFPHTFEEVWDWAQPYRKADDEQ